MYRKSSAQNFSGWSLAAFIVAGALGIGATGAHARSSHGAAPVSGIQTHASAPSGQATAPTRMPSPSSSTTSGISLAPSTAAPPFATTVPSPPVGSTPSPVNVPTIAPLSPPLDTAISSGGGTPTTNSGGGGGGKTLADCMAFWDAGTHMSKPEWRQACQRTLQGIDLLGGVTVTAAQPKTGARHVHNSSEGSGGDAKTRAPTSYQ